MWSNSNLLYRLYYRYVCTLTSHGEYAHNESHVSPGQHDVLLVPLGPPLGPDLLLLPPSGPKAHKKDQTVEDDDGDEPGDVDAGTAIFLSAATGRRDCGRIRHLWL